MADLRKETDNAANTNHDARAKARQTEAADAPG